MYVPSHSRVNDPDEIARFAHGNGFGQLISMVDGQLFSSHLVEEGDHASAAAMVDCKVDWQVEWQVEWRRATGGLI